MNLGMQICFSVSIFYLSFRLVVIRGEGLGEGELQEGGQNIASSMLTETKVSQLIVQPVHNSLPAGEERPLPDHPTASKPASYLGPQLTDQPATAA